MDSAHRERLKRAAIIAALLLVPLGLFVNACGSIHNSECGGALTLVAFALLMPTLPIFDIFHGEPSYVVFWAVFTLTSFAWLTAVAYGVLALNDFWRDPQRNPDR